MPSTTSGRDCPVWGHPVWRGSGWEPTIYTSTALLGPVQYRCNFQSADTDWGPYTNEFEGTSVPPSFRNTFNEDEMRTWLFEAQYSPRAVMIDEGSTASSPDQRVDPPHVRVADTRIAYSLMCYPTICSLVWHVHLSTAEYDRFSEAINVAGGYVNVRETAEEIGIDHQLGASVWAKGPYAPVAVRWLEDADRVVELPRRTIRGP